MGTTFEIRRGLAAALVIAAFGPGCGLAPIQRGVDAGPPKALQPVSSGESSSPPRVSVLGDGQIHTLMGHPLVRERVSYLLKDGRITLRTSLLRGLDFVPMIERELDAEGVPAELAYLPMVESRFLPDAQGRTAVGLWQLTRATARLYGLRVDRGVDERRDPAKSSRAAARYLRDLYRRFESWDLALAAYNAGPARVERALERRPQASFFELARHRLLPPTTRRFVPKVLAAALIGRRPETFGVHLPAPAG